METEIRKALAQGYCSQENSSKEVDAVLIEAMSEHVMHTLKRYFTNLTLSQLGPDHRRG